MNKLQKSLNFTCPECLSVFELLEKHSFQAKQLHHQKSDNCSHHCLNQWKSLLYSHFQEQIILHLASQAAQQDKDHDMTERNDNEYDTK